MRARVPLTLAPLCWSAFAAPAPAPLADVLQACALRAPPAIRGVAALSRECPGLEAALHESGAAELLSDVGRRDLTAAGLEDLAALTRRYAAPPPAGAPAVEPLQRIALAVAADRAQPRSWWEAVRQWLRSLLQSDSTPRPWLERWLGRLAGAADTVTYLLLGLVAAVLIGAAAFIVAEWRRGRTGAPAPSGASPVRPRGLPAPASAALLDDTALQERPALLLRLLVGTLARRGRLQGDRPLTHRELIVRAGLDDEAQRLCFARVAILAEALMYGAGPRDGEVIDGIVGEGRELLLQMEHLDGGG